MKFHRNTERLRKRAAIDVAKKLRLEPYLAKSMRRVLKSMVHDFRVTYASREETIIPIRYKSDVVGVLRDHYRKVIRDFSSSARDELKKKKSLSIKAYRKDKEIDDAIRSKLSPYVLLHSEIQANLIIQTTHDDLQDAIKRLVDESLVSGEPIDAKEIADLVSRDYLSKISGRAEIISVTETQNLAEKTKKTELEEIHEEYEAVINGDIDGDDLDEDELEDADDEQEPKEKLLQVWVAILDDHTRDAHADADGQEVGIDEPFIVDGEELEYPGDPAGSPENIINCRCAAVPVNGDE